MKAKRTRENQEAVQESANLDRIFSALSDPTRREIIRRLAGGPAIVTELAEPFQMSLPAVSRHMKVLQGAGLVVQDKRGRERRCLLNPKPLADITEWSDSCRDFWAKQFESLENYISNLDSNKEPKETKED